MEKRVLTMSSQTAAMKAKRLLLKYGISVRLVRLSPRLTPKGCAWGLEMNVYAVSNVLNHLEENEISFGEIMEI